MFIAQVSFDVEWQTDWLSGVLGCFSVHVSCLTCLVTGCGQGTQIKDVILKPDAPSALLLDKHADYIAAYGSKKDDYVSEAAANTQLLS